MSIAVSINIPNLIFEGDIKPEEDSSLLDDDFINYVSEEKHEDMGGQPIIFSYIQSNPDLIKGKFSVDESMEETVNEDILIEDSRATYEGQNVIEEPLSKIDQKGGFN